MQKIKLSHRWKLFSIISLVLIVALLLVKTSCSSNPEVEYITAPVIRGDIEDNILANGELRAKQQVHVGTQVSGQLKKLYVVVGQKVVKNQLLAEIDSIKQKNDLLNQKAALSQAIAERKAQATILALEQQKLRRQQSLIASGATSQESLEEAESAVYLANLSLVVKDENVTIRRLAVQKALDDFNHTQIRSPLDGTVTIIEAKEGQTIFVGGDTVPTIVTVAQLDKMTITTQVSEADVIRIKNEQDVYFSVLGAPERQFHSKLYQMELSPANINKSDQSSVYYNVLFDVANPENFLRIGMTAQVSIVLNKVKNALIIPVTALGDQKKDGCYAVRVLSKKGVPELRQVKVGINNNIQVQVLSGLKLGEQVILGSSDEKKSTKNGIQIGI